MQTYGLTFSKLLALLLCATLISPLPAMAAAQQPQQQPQQAQPQQPQPQQQKPLPPGQIPPVVPPPQQLPPSPMPVTGDGPTARRLPPGGIKIIVLEGHKVRNSILTKSAISPVIQVLDSQDQPITGAAVTFEVSPTGPGGSFGMPPDQLAPTITVRTDFAGQATSQFTPNAIPGRFSIKATAAIDGQKAVAGLLQLNDETISMAGPEPKPKRWYHSWKWWAVIGGAAVVGIILLTRSGDPTIVISPSPVDIGGPR